MKVVTAETMTKLLERAAMAPRRRINLNLHPETSDPINRFLNAGLAGTYVRPHRHRTEKWELLTILYGKLDVVIFDINGRITNRVALSPQDRCLIEIPGGQWHSFIFRPAVVLEVKPGPYEPQLDKEFAQWAPPEGGAAGDLFVSWLENAPVGQTWPSHSNIEISG